MAALSDIPEVSTIVDYATQSGVLEVPELDADKDTILLLPSNDVMELPGVVECLDNNPALLEDILAFHVFQSALNFDAVLASASYAESTTLSLDTLLEEEEESDHVALTINEGGNNGTVMTNFGVDTQNVYRASFAQSPTKVGNSTYVFTINNLLVPKSIEAELTACLNEGATFKGQYSDPVSLGFTSSGTDGESLGILMDRQADYFEFRSVLGVSPGPVQHATELLANQTGLEKFGHAYIVYNGDFCVHALVYGPASLEEAPESDVAFFAMYKDQLCLAGSICDPTQNIEYSRAMNGVSFDCANVVVDDAGCKKDCSTETLPACISGRLGDGADGTTEEDGAAQEDGSVDEAESTTTSSTSSGVTTTAFAALVMTIGNLLI